MDAYVAEHAGEWRRLQWLAQRRRLSAAQADELVELYQRTATHLSLIRSRSPDPVLVARLSHLVLAARSAITGPGVFSWRSIGRFFTVSFPLETYRAWRWWTAVAAGFVALSGALIGYVAGHPDAAHVFMSADEIDQVVNTDFVGYYSAYQPQNFAFQVWTNNAWLSAQCLASGVLIVPVLYLLAMNALNTGVMGGVMVSAGRADVFFGYLAPHGLLELTAVFIAAGVGLRVGWAWIAPGPGRTRGQALTRAARSGMLVALGLVGVLAVSGLLEAFVTPSGLPTVLRVGVGAVVWLAFLTYVVVAGRRAARTDPSS
nr:stage II sporulation protein M [Planosporangium thailandense]